MSLTKTAKDFKKGLRIFTILAFVYYLFILVIIPNSKNILRKLLPEKNPPNPIYGALDPIKFSVKQITNQSPRYVLDTKNGRLPEDLPTKMRVYKINKPQFSYLAGSEAENTAKMLGFTQQDLSSDLKGDILTWKSLLSGGSLSIQKSSGQIIANTSFYLKPEEYRPGNLDEEKAKLYAVDAMRKMERMDELYEETNGGSQVVTLGRINNNSTINTLLFAETQFARVDFFRQIDKQYPIFGPDPKRGLLEITLRNPTLGFSPYNYPVLDINYHKIEGAYRSPKDKTPIDPTKIATYPIIYPDEAWGEVRKNNGVIVSVVPKDANLLADYEPTRVESIYIKDIYLAYFEPKDYVPYLQPIYVFHGNYTTKGTTGGDITIYFPAITKEFIKTTAPASK